MGVALVFDGAVQTSGSNVRASVHLEDPVRHAMLWSGGIEGPHADGARLQGQISHTIVSVLACSYRALTPRRGLTEPALLSRYLHACDLFTRTNYDERKVYELLGALREVTVGAPDFVPARTDLAKFGAYFSAFVPADQAGPLCQEAEAEAHRALKLDPKAPDGYLALEMLLPPTQWTEREKSSCDKALRPTQVGRMPMAFLEKCWAMLAASQKASPTQNEPLRLTCKSIDGRLAPTTSRRQAIQIPGSND